MNAVKTFLFKILRMIGIVALLYICLLLYMVLSERRLAFPRAEADKASEETLRSGAILCHVDDNKKLQGWTVNDSLEESVLCRIEEYYLFIVRMRIIERLFQQLCKHMTVIQKVSCSLIQF